MRAFLVACIAGLAFAASVSESAAETLTTATGYQLEYSVFGKGANGPIALIVMHGKNFPPERLRTRPRWADRVIEEGFMVYVPVMPWGQRWDGTHEDATAAVDALVDLAAKEGKKVIVGGHSMGAMFTILYRASALPPAIIGKFVSAPGHMLDLIDPNSRFWDDINPSIDRARKLEAAGKGKEKVQFGGRNVTGSQNITESYEMTPEVYLSFHDPRRLPSNFNALKATSVPVLWTVGDNDPLSRSNAGQNTFRLMPANPKSVFLLLEGKDHSSSFPASIEHLISWMKSLAAQQAGQ